MRNLLVLFGLLTTVPAHASDLVLIHARAYPSPTAAPIENATIVIHDNRIVSVRASGPLPLESTILDCTGMTVTAGLWNSHIHILPQQFLHADQKTGAQLTTALQEMLTSWGFTTVFDIASVLANDNNIRARIAAGEVSGPRIFTTGEPFFPEHGVPVYVKDYLDQNHIVLPDDPTTAAAVARVRSEIRDGADGIKIFAGSIQSRSVLMMPVERAKAIVTAAHQLHKPVFAHPTTIEGVEIALNSGVDILAHVTEGEDWPQALVQRLLVARTALIPTLMLFDEEAKKDHMSPADIQTMIDRAVSKLRAYSAAGGEILFGTDVGYIYNFNPSEEYSLMQKAGLTFPQILASLTTNPARRFKAAGKSGRIGAHMDADLTVFADDPAVDITALSRVRYTIRAGKVIYQSPPRDRKR